MERRGRSHARIRIVESPAKWLKTGERHCNGSCSAGVEAATGRVAQVSHVRCSWCGAAVEPDDGFRAAEEAGERLAVFCRLEHVVPWAMRGPHWDAGTLDAPPAATGGTDLERCAHCDAQLDDTRVVLVRHRGEHRIADAFCGTDHLLAWAKAGGRWR
jgi:hypothetical protein